MKKICIVGHFGLGLKLLNGQTIKTKTIYNELKNQLGNDNVFLIDTHNWKKKPIKLIFNCLIMMKKSDYIIILPAHNGLRIFARLFYFLNFIFKKKLLYIVIGGWLPSYISNRKNLKKILQKYNGIFVETSTMKNELTKMGFCNVTILPNCKNLDIISKNELNNIIHFPLKLCTFSRVIKNKGIEDIIRAVSIVNNSLKNNVFNLDIYGQISLDYSEEFNILLKNVPSYIQYKGEVDFNHSVEVLKQYDALVFPTKFYTEGIPGTIIDAFAAGLPVISSKWESYSDLIDDQVGIGYEFNDINGLINILYTIQLNPEILINMKKNCIARAQDYTSVKVINDFIEYIFRNI